MNPLDRISVPAARLAVVCARYHVHELALFGSALRDDFGPESDLDLLVEFEPGAQIGFVAFARLQGELSGLFGRRVDLVPKDGLKPLVRREILPRALILYAA